MPSNIVVPEVGESIVDARIAKWLRREGDVVAAGDPLVELETDKIDLEVSAPQAGVVGRIARQDGDDVKVGEVLGVIEDAASAIGPHPTAAAEPAAAAVSDSSGAPAGSAQAPVAEPQPAPSPSASASGKGPRATPTARKAAEDKAVNLASVRGSGDAGRVMKRDVEQAAGSTSAPAPVTSPGAPPATAAPVTPPTSVPPPAAPPKTMPPVAETPRVTSRDRTEERVRMSKRRSTIARRLVEVQATAAMLTTFNEVDMSAIMSLRERHKQSFKERHGIGLGIASFFVKASIGALRAFPRINAEIQGDEMVVKHYFDIGVAVGASEGLVVPVLRDADGMSFAQIETQIRAFATKAEDGTLSLADLKGGTFTITNGGVFGSLLSTPILNPPQVGILGLHKIMERPIALNGQVVVRPMMYLALTYDHRIVDGAEAVQFLVRVKSLVEDPGALLLD
jgi:2-oxoglutarate dehydrogenase E2 component (dihydrolipoamide succinyltransferase)